ncbi:MAG: hypothetical protein JXX14_08580 [Deltaproteobacteria bacterium]|nr:hypothetical protein [Deltaproteobacteria bacterium]
MKIKQIGGLLLICAIVCQQSDTAQRFAAIDRRDIVVPDTHVAPAKSMSSYIPPWSPADRIPTQPVHRICFRFLSDVAPVLLAEVMTLLGHVPNLAVGGVCDGENDLKVVVATSERFEPEEIQINCPAGDGMRVVHVMSGVGHGSIRPLGIAVMRLLSLLGFSFLHPLSPNIPGQASFPIADVNIHETPHLEVRGIHLHTMHPVEFSDFLNGWGTGGIDDAEGFEQWFEKWKTFLLWMLGNGLNRVQWALLWNEKWGEFGDSELRQDRLKEIVQLTHLFGIEAGIDAPVSLKQQNAFRLVRREDSPENEHAQIRTQIDYLMKTDIDFLALEIGTSEFSHASPSRMLSRLNYIASYLDDTYAKRATVKVHVSTGQHVDDLVDPVDGGALNVNFLPWYADKRLGVMPHSVAYYGLTDPAPVYGNSDFTHIDRYIQREIGRREVLWYPESAYWCSFDVDVPLFLPLYAERRMKDLRHLAREQKRRPDGAGIDGQVIFSSGWEWGYWLGDVVAARAAWNPLLKIEDDDAAFVAMLENVLSVFEETAYPVATQLAKVAFTERRSLITGMNTANVGFDETLTGQAYLQGVEPLDEMVAHLTRLPGASLTPTQPNRISLLFGNDARVLTTKRVNQVSRLLAQMKRDFALHHYRFTRLAPVIDRDALDIYHEFVDAMEITALRAAQVAALYSWKVSELNSDTEQMAQLSTLSKELTARASRVVQNRELFYRTPSSVIAAWRNNPTAYGFGYLWTVHSLYFWRRDHLRITGEDTNPCAANIYDPVLLAFGQPASDSRMGVALKLLSSVTTLNWRSCLEITVPPDL